MFAHISFTAFLALPLLATATVLPRGILPTGIIPAGIIPTGIIPSGGGEGAACATGSAQCCDSTQSSTDLSAPVSSLLGLLGVVVGQLTGNVGVSCSPITVVGLGGTQCSNQVVCCDDNNFVSNSDIHINSTLTFFRTGLFLSAAPPSTSASKAGENRSVLAIFRKCTRLLNS
ncbi:fungal hydrophobin-domain-containing protein [Armillaria borealis]|uniref:Hydrophobin n=1 Tax=Armillaria borealis TaxID=47425 RepID=A0AA39MM07_9AGAR|nr:fungal hydrophobin-domain-containing protein [Armillaria borealis]